MSETKTQVVSATCPDCGKVVRLRAPVRVGQEVACPHCEAELEVIETDPVELDWVYDEYDGDDDDDDDDSW
jgi:lysine biosynthesis protein LysW